MAANFERPITVFVHGSALSSRMFRTLIPILEDKYGYPAIITPDLPGHGSSKDQGPFSFEASTDLLHQTTQAFKFTNPGRKISIIGISLGGQAVLEYISHYP